MKIYKHNFTRLDKNLEIYLIEGDQVSNQVREMDYSYLSTISNIDFEEILYNKDKYLNSTILDIGSHIGIFAHFIYNFIKCDRLIAFEPMGITYKALVSNVSEKNAMNCVVGDSDKYVSMESPRSTNVGMNHVVPNPYLGHDDNYVKERPLSEFTQIKQVKIDSLNLKNVDLVKIDVETWECKVIDGAISTFAEYKPDIFLELHWEAKSEFIESTVPKLKNIGYDVPYINPVSRICHNIKLINKF